MRISSATKCSRLYIKCVQHKECVYSSLSLHYIMFTSSVTSTCFRWAARPPVRSPLQPVCQALCTRCTKHQPEGNCSHRRRARSNEYTSNTVCIVLNTNREAVIKCLIIRKTPEHTRDSIRHFLRPLRERSRGTRTLGHMHVNISYAGFNFCFKIKWINQPSTASSCTSSKASPLEHSVT